MEQFVWETAEELDQKLAQRVRNIRKRRSISQEKLSSMSGVSYGSIKRFETTGQISLISLTKIAMALDIADELRNIFTHVPYKDIQEVINEGKVMHYRYFMMKKLVGTLAMTADRKAAFQYSEEWIENGFPISPFSLPLKKAGFLYRQKIILTDYLEYLQIVLPDNWGEIVVGSSATCT